jgi:hypothetical protein
MAGKPIGTLFVELDLDSSRYLKGQQQILKDAQVVTFDIEKNFKNLGLKSSAAMDLSRAQIVNAYQGILHSANTTANDIVRAEEAKNSKLKALNEQQFGAQTSFLDTLKKNWMAVSAVAIAAYMLIQRAYSFAKDIAITTNEMKRNAEIAGLSTDEYQKWAFAAKMADVNAEELSKGFRLLSRNMSEASQGTGAAKNAFLAMGISVNQVGGGLKPLDVMMKEIMNKFAGWADGPQKIALALALFGRSGEALIPLLNKGAAGFNEFSKEAAKLGIILDPTLINAGSRAEDTFKKINAQLEAGKLRLAPYAEGFANLILSMLEKLNDLKSWAIGNPKIWGFITGAIIPAPINIAVGLLGIKGGKSELEKVQDQYLQLEDYYKGLETKKPPAPAIVDPKLALEAQQILLQQKMTLATMTRDIEAQVKLTMDLAKNEKARLAESQKLTPELSKQLDLTASAKVVEIRRKEQEYQLGISNTLIKMQSEYAGITGDLKEQSAILDKELVNKLQQLAIDVQAHKLTKDQAKAQAEIEIALRDQAKLRFEDTGALSIHQKAIYDDSVRYAGSMANINLEYNGLIGNLKKVEKAEQDILDNQILVNAYTAEEYIKLQQILDLKQKRRKEDIEIISQGRANLSVLEAQANKQNELNQIKVGLGWMRPGQAGLQELDLQKGLLEAMLQQAEAEEKINTDLMQQPKLLADIKVLQIQLIANDKARLKYISETAPAYEGLASGLQKYVTESGTLYTQLETMSYNTAKGMEGAFSNFFQSIFDNTKTWKEKMAGLFKGLADAYIKALSDMLAKQLTSGLFGGSSGSGGNSTGLLGTIVKGLGGLVGGLFSPSSPGTGGAPMGAESFSPSAQSSMVWLGHTGKGPGELPSFYRVLPPETFYNAPRLHQGIGGDEMAAIIRRDESVLTPAQMKALTPARPNQSVSVGPINIQMEKGQGLNPATLKKDIETAVIEVIKRHM